MNHIFSLSTYSLKVGLLTLAASSLVLFASQSALAQNSHQLEGSKAEIQNHIATRNMLQNRPLQAPLGLLSTYQNIWKTWPKSVQERYAKNGVSLEQMPVQDRMKVINRYYGFFESPSENSDGTPMGLVATEVAPGVKTVTTNCLMCHASRIDGKVIWGGRNPMLDFQSLMEDMMRSDELANGKPMTESNFPFPLVYNTSAGGFNTIEFVGKGLAWRDKNLDVVASFIEGVTGQKPLRNMGNLTPADSTVLPWWNTKLKKRMFWDGWLSADSYRHSAAFRILMTPVGTVSGQIIRDEEALLHQIHNYTVAHTPPKFPSAHIEEGALNKAERGRQLFNTSCAKCHGQYDDPAKKYPEFYVSNERIKFDGARLSAVTPEYLQSYREWMTEFDLDPKKVRTKAEQERGYLSPPLKGIWALAPYFHNGSVPTLYHVIMPEKRPKIWRINTVDSFDKSRVGLKIDEFEAIPDGLRGRDRRTFVNTSDPGKSNMGHDNRIFRKFTEVEAMDLIEYLKTL